VLHARKSKTYCTVHGLHELAREAAGAKPVARYTGYTSWHGNLQATRRGRCKGNAWWVIISLYTQHECPLPTIDRRIDQDLSVDRVVRLQLQLQLHAMQRAVMSREHEMANGMHACLREERHCDCEAS
jgi:hypothetical protein